MAIADLASTKPGMAVKGPTCQVCIELARLPKAEAAGLLALLSDPLWRYTELAARLREDPDTPLDIPSTTLARHARGGCAAKTKLR
jgi:hypothetical protein